MIPGTHIHNFGAIRNIRILLVEYTELQVALSQSQKINPIIDRHGRAAPKTEGSAN